MSAAQRTVESTTPLVAMQAAYDRRRATTSVDTHRNELAQVKTFQRWAGKRGLVSRALVTRLDTVEGVGKRRHGKAQLRIMEARQWTMKALELAEAGDTGAIAAMLTLFQNLRAGEVVSRTVRDVDDYGRVLWVPDSKTEAGKRVQEVPPVLARLLWRLAEGRQPEELLFGQHWRDWPRKQVQRICGLAGVPIITAHGMRGTHSSMAQQMGATSHAVAAAMGHSSERVTVESYTDPTALHKGRQDRMLQVLTREPQAPETAKPTRVNESAPSESRNTLWN